MEGRTPTYEIELRLRAKTGEWIWILARGKIVSRDENNAPVRVVGTHVDISVRKRIEEQLHQSEERLKFAIEGSNDGVWDYQVNTGETYRNSRWYTMLGYEPGELEGLSWSEGNELVHPEDRPRFEQVWADHLEGRTPSHEMELRVRTKTGEWMWILSRGKIVSRDENNAPVRVVGTHTDITARKQMEGELERARRRMADELNVGREIQMSMLPLTFPPYPRRREFEVYALLEPAREVGGDFYDFFLIDDDHFCMCVGDVSGKGVPAALFMAVTKTLLKSRASNDYSPASILTHVNNEISRSNDASMFVTIFLAILDLNSGELLYSNAGHNPPYIRRAHGELIRLDQRHGPVIGAVEDIVYGQDEAILTRGDLFFAYTDGVTEAMNEEQRLYDERRLAELLSSSDSNDAEAVVRATLEGIRSFQGNAAQADDITILATTYYGEPEGAEVRVLHLSLVNRLDEIGRIHESFNAFAEEHGVPTPIRRQINLVLDELLSNVISYAFEDDEEREIDVRIELSSDRLAVTIADDGIPFNPFSSAPPDTSLSLEERELGGLGIHVVSKVMDEVSYNRRTDRNVVILVKYLDDSSGY
jgi:sigma-B regulation protein RsbU (phosphoserine phosphatase)